MPTDKTILDTAEKIGLAPEQWDNIVKNFHETNLITFSEDTKNTHGESEEFKFLSKYLENYGKLIQAQKNLDNVHEKETDKLNEEERGKLEEFDKLMKEHETLLSEWKKKQEPQESKMTNPPPVSNASQLFKRPLRETVNGNDPLSPAISNPESEEKIINHTPFAAPVPVAKNQELPESTPEERTVPIVPEESHPEPVVEKKEPSKVIAPKPSIESVAFNHPPSVNKIQEIFHAKLEQQGMSKEAIQQFTVEGHDKNFSIKKGDAEVLKVEELEGGKRRTTLSDSQPGNEEEEAKLMIAALLTSHGANKNDPSLATMKINVKDASPALQAAIKKEAESCGFKAENIKTMVTPASETSEKEVNQELNRPISPGGIH